MSRARQSIFAIAVSSIGAVADSAERFCDCCVFYRGCRGLGGAFLPLLFLLSRMSRTRQSIFAIAVSSIGDVADLAERFCHCRVFYRGYYGLVSASLDLPCSMKVIAPF